MRSKKTDDGHGVGVSLGLTFANFEHARERFNSTSVTAIELIFCRAWMIRANGFESVGDFAQRSSG